MRRSRLWGSVVLFASWAATGCTGDDGASSAQKPHTELICGEAAVVVELGTAMVGQPPLHFTVNDGQVWIAVVDVDESGFLESTGQVVGVFLGPADNPPTYDTGRSAVPQATHDVTVRDGRYSQVELDPGDYWLWQTKGGVARVASCEPEGVVVSG